MSSVKPGKSLEQLVAAIERILAGNDNVVVESPKYLLDRITGSQREHDVLITLKGSHHISTIAIECRDRSRKITVNDVEAFSAKCNDTGIDRGIMVSLKGFTKSALAKGQFLGIRFLLLSEVSSFNWLLANGIKVCRPKILHENWTFFPEKDISTKPILFSILNLEGEPVSSDNLKAALLIEFQKILANNLKEVGGTVNIMFNKPGLLMRDDSTGIVYPIVKALASVEYTLINDFIPFDLIKYENVSSEEVISDVAIAELDIGTIKGKVIVAYDFEQGGNVCFVPEKAQIPQNKE